MTESRQDLIAAAIRAQEHFVHTLLALAEQDWVALDLTLTQLKSLMVLIKHDGIPIHQLADTLRLGRPATSTLVEQLVRLRLVLRTEDPSDRRRTLVRLTAEGTAFVTRLRQGREDKLHSLLNALTDEDLITLVRIMEALNQAAKSLPISPEEGDR